MPARGLNHGFDRPGLHQRRGPAAEEDRGQRAARQQLRLICQIGEQGVAPFVLADFGADMAVEVAIGTFADAKRPMDVKRERFASHSFRAATNLRNASTRWLILCFASGSISPNVCS